MYGVLPTRQWIETSDDPLLILSPVPASRNARPRNTPGSPGHVPTVADPVKSYVGLSYLAEGHEEGQRFCAYYRVV